MGGLSVSRLVRVNVNLTPSGAQALSFGILVVAGDSSVINPVERLRSYTDFDSVAADLGLDAPETKAAELYFGQSPQPSTIMIGRWVRTATAGQNIGGILSSSQQLMNIWNSITAGAFDVTINGVVYHVTALDFSTQTNLNGVASVIQSRLVMVGATGATCVWNGQYFVITSGSTGAGVKASGTIAFSDTTSDSDTLTLGGTTLFFKDSPAGPLDVQIGATAQLTAANLMNVLLNSTDANLSECTYARVGATVTATFKQIGVVGNAFTMAAASLDINLSGATLANGAEPSSVGYLTGGISEMLLMTSTTSQALIAGFDAETPAQCAAALASVSPLWYGLMFQASVQPTDDQNMDVAAFIEAQDTKRVFGVTITNTNVLSALVTTDLASRLKASGFNRSVTQYSQNAYAVASFFGRNFSINFSGSNTVIAMMYKQEPAVAAETITPSQADTLQAKNCNVFVNYVNGTAIVQFGVMASGVFFDEIQDTDWLRNQVQTNVYNVMFTSPTKVPQTDSGVNQILGSIAAAMQQGVNNGTIAPGTWNGPAFGGISTGDFLKTGYYLFAQPLALQSEADRAARKCPPIQCAVKLAGAIQTVDILIDVNQ